MEKTHCRVVVLISGNGSNLQALIDDSASSNYEVTHVISNNPEAFGLQRAAQSNIATSVINHRDYNSREEFGQALIASIDAENPQLIVLAGFMRILSADFVQHYSGRVLNIHPSLLPKYTGTNTHQRVLDAKEREHGVSVHFVTEELDGGPVIAQETVSVAKNDTAETLAKKVASREHLLYPRVVRWFAMGKLHMEGHMAVLDGEAINKRQS